jgi:NAD(P)-dependent dehydrogenase (short-subunit alcohol dehydrogenase family)
MTQLPQQQVWFVTGVSRGFGEALARELLGRGHHVVGTTRDGTAPALVADAPTLASDGGDLDGATRAETPAFDVVTLDVTDPEQAARAVQQAHARHGRIDVVVNNAGYGLLGSVEGASDAEVREVFEVNFFGALRVMQAALPLLRAQGHGHLVSVVSIAALAPSAGSGVYAAAKAALRAASVGLWREASPLGIGMTIVSPGQFRTDFLSDHSIRASSRTLDAYSDTAGAALDGLSQVAGAQQGDPVKAASAIVDAVTAPEPPLDLVLGNDALARAHADADRLDKDMHDWEQVSRATIHDDAKAV